MYPQIRARGHGEPEVGDACFFLSKDTGYIRRTQKSHRLLSNAVDGQRLREGTCEIRDGEGVNPVSA